MVAAQVPQENWSFNQGREQRVRHTGLNATVPCAIHSLHNHQRTNMTSFRVTSALVRLFALTILSIYILSCTQYEYSSPSPGYIEIRFAVKNNRQDLLPFAPDSLGFAVNNMFMNLRDLTATQGDIELPIYADVNAIRRNADGDPFNCLDTRARDSLLVFGRCYAPPEVFTGLEVTIEPPPLLFISQGFYGSTIPIVQVPPVQALQKFEGLNISVNQGRITQVVVTFDMDSSLVQLSESFAYIPHYYVSSVTNY